jgi:hypothetical protein
MVWALAGRHSGVVKEVDWIHEFKQVIVLNVQVKDN